ncbi:bifunctional UDP-N-acetylglucosamine diphosphorylase/glucosamine-1-phosphate N-acetyltransferase GlmU [Carboxydothermus hydrogenoformans]|uniref:Bifunctional protein GlmU n=1 Tax=Carboxydothermus hydrogenoformans (strain ATCC BAA-161 / DSM 6008 / Z-2901) TaxID=246194 RepID=GLMU_CARHZ|nr:bifunctional UDP-N-acetylglucosamine diphosphorylase/glucosamine-1-phosphate N-acetyltransferase GlmU [Carboxydothermus hydrogenoformans]Q3AFM0.1 RecName: Full=Bifunctional protein GlmU; Includes: RecName: Full=UDP-N-acetylglucosamine pyrophosphorylase; AltName: Full=N-acetylglucosamine-1-phosphate uridyltransferase; Includes: RecName: Full=Glucosamine-1-phosphate N-acetyltransferase [Carboxydothermus hydrogenoformans Z-2901]ABB15469.1 UDP-N-acetylglucosamine pyrophosphorylase [Carboxydothermu
MEGIILAAGKGTRMKSDLPKVVHEVAEKPMVLRVYEALVGAGVKRVVAVVGYRKEKVEEILRGRAVIAVQEEQLGTGHAALVAMPYVEDENVIIVPGDTPLLKASTLQALIKKHLETGAYATVLTCFLSNPYGYGRIVRDGYGKIIKIVEEKDATLEEKQIAEVNTGIYCFNTKILKEILPLLKAENAQKEYYLTDVIPLLLERGKVVETITIQDETEVYGVNDRVQLARLTKGVYRRKAEALMQEGVTIIDPETVYIGEEVVVGSDTVIYPNTYLEGKTVIGSGCRLGPNTRITDSVIGNNTEITFSVIIQARVGDEVNVGPFAYLRPGTEIANGVKIGDFVEIKKSFIGEGSKVPHLSYIGDAVVGKGVNIGAGTITCNYDGKNKWETVIEDGAFIGSNTNLVAPIKIGKNAVVGAGSTLTEDVPEKALAIARSRQVNKEDYVK